MPGWMKHKLKSKLLGEILMTLRNADDITLMVESKEELKSLLMKVKEESEKLVLNVSYILFLSGDLKIQIKSGC